MNDRPFLLLGLLVALIAASLTACSGQSVAPAAPAATVAPTTSPTEPPAAPTALTISCAELVPAAELERIIGTQPASLMDTVMPGWTACTWFYTPPGASQQVDFIVQAYTGEETLVKWRMDTNPANRKPDVVVNNLNAYVQEGYTWVIPDSQLRAVQALQDGRYIFLRFPANTLALSSEAQIADYLQTLFGRLK